MDYLPEWAIWALTAVIAINTMTATWLVKHKRIEGWYVSLANQTLWFTVNLDKGLWGFFFLQAFLIWQGIHAIILWRRDAALKQRARDGDDAALVECLQKEPRFQGMIPVHINRAERDYNSDED